jgi:HTH-type transcriptional regulator / antitoxin HipB
LDYSVKTVSQLRPILQGFRKAAGMTQATMAARLGVTQQTYAQLEANPAAASVERLFKVLRVLGIELSFSAPDELSAKTNPPARRAARSSAKSREDW